MNCFGSFRTLLLVGFLFLFSACHKNLGKGVYRVRVSAEGVANKIYGLKIRYQYGSEQVELDLDDSINRSLSSYTTAPLTVNGKLFVAACIYRGIVDGEMAMRIEILKGASGEKVVAKLRQKAEKGTYGRSFGHGLSYPGAYLASYLRLPAQNIKGYKGDIMPAQEYVFPRANTFDNYDK